MALYRNISTAFWTDQKVDDDFTPEDKYFYLYLLTNPHTNICGCFEISWKQLSSETGYTRETIFKLIDRMQRIHQVIRFDEDTMEILLLNWGKYNWSHSERLCKAVNRAAELIKNNEFKEFVLNALLQITVTNNSKQITDNSKQKTVTVTDTVTDTVTVTDTAVATDVSIGYRYPINRVSGQKQKKTKFSNFEERNYDYDSLEKELRNNPTG